MKQTSVGLLATIGTKYMYIYKTNKQAQTKKTNKTHKQANEEDPCEMLQPVPPTLKSQEIWIESLICGSKQVDVLKSFQLICQRRLVMKLQHRNFRNYMSPWRTGTLLMDMKNDENTKYRNSV